MKVAFILLILPLFVNGQPKNTNQIVVHNIGFDTALNRLLDAGYNIDKKDREIGTIKTEYKFMTGFLYNSYKHLLYITVIPEGIRITGTWETTGGQGEIFQFPITKRKSEMDKKFFNIMNDFAKTFGQPIDYYVK
ncbi:MAG: hypothetical protein U0T79_05320 [Ferruginibacter sp.]